MITTYLGLSIRIWVFSGDPDNDVHTSGGSYADIGEIFMNTSNGTFFICTQTGVGTQTWQPTINTTVIQNLIESTVLQSDWNQVNSSYQDFIKNKPSIPNAQIQSDWEQTNNSEPDYIKNKPLEKSQSSVARSLNTAFQISSTRWSTVRYSIDVSTTVSLSGSQVGTVILEMAEDSEFTIGVQTLQEFSNGNTGTLVIGLVLNQLITACLSGEVPPGNYVRLRTVNVTGTPTFTYKSGQELLI